MLITANKLPEYPTIGSTGKPASMGTYDLSVGRPLNVSFVNQLQVVAQRYLAVLVALIWIAANATNKQKNATYLKGQI